MTDKCFYNLWAEALTSSDRDAYVSDWALSSIWGDEDTADVPQERIDYLGKLWDAAHMSVRDIVAASGLSQTALAMRFCVPKRTIEDWCTSKRLPPDYVRLMMVELLGLLHR